MNVEKSGYFNFGFVLNEQNIRRIVSTAKEQLDKIAEKDEKKFNYKIKLENGSIIDDISLDEILTLENHGSLAVKTFELHFKVEKTKNSIKINFSKIKENNKKISYYISSSDRDWVFITMSLINEKILLIKRNDLLLYTQNNFLDWYMAITIGLFFAFCFNTINYTYKENTCYENTIKITDYGQERQTFAIDLLEKKFNKKPDINITNALLMRDKILNEFYTHREELTKKRDNKLKKCNKEHEKNRLSSKKQTSIASIVIFFTFPVLTFCYSVVSSKLYPLYTFCWGTEEELFLKRETQRKFILGTIFTGLLISIAAGIFVNFF